MTRKPTTQVDGYAVTVECDPVGKPFRAIARVAGRVHGVASTADALDTTDTAATRTAWGVLFTALDNFQTVN